MARPIVVGNGELHVGLNKYGLVHDLYYPYVGLENHAAGSKLRHKVGVFVDGRVSWLDEEGWTFTFRYPHTALVGHTLAKNESLGVILEFDDAVDAEMSVFMRNIHVVNLFDRPREIKLFMHQAFAIGDSRSNTDTAQYLPDSHALLHYRGRRAFIISGSYKDAPFDQFTIGLFGIEGHEGSYKDAEDGILSGNPVEHGRVDSVIGFTIPVAAHSSERAHYWLAAGMSTREALYIHKQMNDHGLIKRLHKTADWWHHWLQPAFKITEKIPYDHQDMFFKSLMIMKSQMDKRGAVIASTDSTMLNYGRDAYAYHWPRDGANTMWPFIRIGYYDEPYRFFEFSKRGLHPDGYLMHKYRADGALGSSWHPYLHADGITSPPIQTDETASVVFMFGQFYQANPNPSLLKEFYIQMIQPMANFLSDYIDDVSGLPRPSYDLWEQKFATSTYTSAVTYGALLAASELAVAAEDHDHAVKWRSAANDIKASAARHLFNPDRQVFYKSTITLQGTLHKDQTIDLSSIFGSYLYGLFDVDSPELNASIQTMKDTFLVMDDEPGLPRFENDDYRRDDPAITGNWWPITTLWHAQYMLQKGDFVESRKILDWVKTHALKSGMLPEQINPVTDEIVSPAPLTWSHAEYVSTLLDTIKRTS